MITGFNTDIEHEGIVYHVQTEDKGLESPLILSLVYIGGTILASKRSPYHDLIEKGFDEKSLIKRLERQHRLICAAIHAGRIEELKKMGRREKEATEPPLIEKVLAPFSPELSPVIRLETTPPTSTKTAIEAEEMPSVAAEVIPEASASDETEDVKPTSLGPLQLKWLNEKQLHAGKSVTLKVKLSRGEADNQSIIRDAQVTAKILGTAFRPLAIVTTTDQKGIAVIQVTLPLFTTGRAAILIRAAVGSEDIEMRRIIHRA